MKNAGKYTVRILVLPFVIPMVLITALFMWIRWIIYFIKYGGEFIRYSEKNESRKINDIYQSLKKCNELKCKVCGKEFTELDIKLKDSRPKDICVACFTNNN